jgi:7-keto-8-aminopelargonate synthetase-like enzyme
LNHASLIDGLRLSKATRTVIPHGTRPPLRSHTADGFDWWITEAIFSMDGDTVRPDAVRTYLEAGHCVYLDEAHAFGLYPRGLGLAGAHDLQPTALIGTLGKALGCAGAFVAGSRPLCAWIRSRARSFVFSTGISPALVLRINAALDLLRGNYGDEARDRLWENVARLARALDDAAPISPIFPVHVGDNQVALELSADLLAKGWHVQPIRPPTVPDGTARLRVTVTATHTIDQLERFAADLTQALDRRGIPLRVHRRDPAPLRPDSSPPA